MAVLSGKTGTLHLDDVEVAPLSNWRLSIAGHHREYVASDTGGATRRTAGATDCGGSFVVAVRSGGHCPAAVGDAVVLKLHVDRSGANYYQVPAIIDRIEADVDVAEGKPIDHTIAFSGNGSFTSHGILAPSQ